MRQLRDDMWTRLPCCHGIGDGHDGLPQSYLPGKNMLAVGAGGYQSEYGMAIGLSGITEDIRDDGTAAQLEFPGAADAALAEGTYPDVVHLRALADKGATKDQLYQALGRRHFPAGSVGVREWDYLFHFRDGGRVTTCQYKVIFDGSGHVGSSHWKQADCSARVQQVAGTP